MAGVIEREELLGLPESLQRPTGVWDLWQGEKKAYSILVKIVPTNGIELSRIAVLRVTKDSWIISSYSGLSYRVGQVKLAPDKDGKYNNVTFLNQDGKEVASICLPGENLELKFQKEKGSR